MNRLFLLLLTVSVLSAEDVLTVDPVTGSVTVSGAVPSAPTSGQVQIGGGHVKAGGPVTADDVIIKRAATTNANNEQAVRGDDTRLWDARPANGGNADTVGGLAPGGANGLAQLDDSGRLLTSQLPSGLYNAPALPTTSLDSSGVTLGIGGIFSVPTSYIENSQTLSVPTRIYCSGDLVITAAITTTAPLEIEAAGIVSVYAPITTPFLSIRCGALALNANISAHGTKTASAWSFDRLKLMSQPDPATVDPLYDSRAWRAILIETQDVIITTSIGTMIADDVFIYCGGSAYISGEINARWLLPNIDVYSPPNVFTWTDGIRVYSPDNYGGVGGTGGGWGKGRASSRASIWRQAARPYLQHTYDLARGSMGRNWRSSQRGAPGGRISIYAHGDLTAYSTAISANSNNSNGSGWMVGGAGTVRAVAGGALIGGSWTANGGTGNGSQEHGGGGGVYLLAAAIVDVVSITATAVSQAVAGTAMSETAPSGAIRGLAMRGLFAAFPPNVPLR